MGVFSSLANLMRDAVEAGAWRTTISRRLDALVRGQEIIMATLADVQARLDAQTAQLADFPSTLSQLSDAVANVAADIQALKDRIGQGTPGITAQEADGVVAQLDAMQTALAESVSALRTATTSLQTVADGQ